MTLKNFSVGRRETVGLIAPGIMFGAQFRSVIEEGGIQNVFAIWFGLSSVMVLGMSVIIGIGQLFI
jgi:hypothetical protein